MMRLSRAGIVVLAVLVTVGLLYLMMTLINADFEAEDPKPPMPNVNIHQPDPPETPKPTPPPDKPDTEQKPEVEEWTPPVSTVDPTKPVIEIPTIDIDVTGETTISQWSEPVPLVQPPANYPRNALRQGLEGVVTVGFTITANGSTRDVEVLEAFTSSGEPTTVFNSSAVSAVERYKYRPRFVDGVAVDVPSMRTRVRFEMSNPES